MTGWGGSGSVPCDCVVTGWAPAAALLPAPSPPGGSTNAIYRGQYDVGVFDAIGV